MVNELLNQLTANNFDVSKIDISNIDISELFNSAEREVIEKINSAKENFKTDILFLSIGTKDENLLCEMYTVENKKYKWLSNFRLVDILLSKELRATIHMLVKGEAKVKFDNELGKVDDNVLQNLQLYAEDKIIKDIKVLCYPSEGKMKFVATDNFKKVADIDISEFLKFD